MIYFIILFKIRELDIINYINMKGVYMFGLLSNKKRKLVKKWKSDHLKIIEVAGSVVSSHAVHDHIACKKHLVILSGLASSHFMNEDIEFFKLLRENKFNFETEKSMNEFIEGFRKTKLELMKTLSYYSKKEVSLEGSFFDEFNELVSQVTDRIQYEESNLYSLMEK